MTNLKITGIIMTDIEMTVIAKTDQSIRTYVFTRTGQGMDRSATFKITDRYFGYIVLLTDIESYQCNDSVAIILSPP